LLKLNDFTLTFWYTCWNQMALH